MQGRDLGSTVEEAIAKVEKRVKLPVGYKLEWSGEYESAKRSQKRLAIVVPLTLLVICLILYTMFNSVKWVLLIIANVAMAPLGGLLALLVTGTHISVSSGVGFLALFGVSVQTGVIMLGIHQPVARAWRIHPRCSSRWLRTPVAPDHDDDARRQRGPASCRGFKRNRFRLSASFRHRHRRRTRSGVNPGRVPAADLVRLGRW